jgi:fluoroquinolone resistance protein
MALAVGAARPASGAHREGETFIDVDWADVDLSDAVFIDCVFEDANFTDANLSGARFLRCRLPRCRMSHADLRDVVFEDCQFADARSRTGLVAAFCRLDEASFARCDLTLSLFDRSSLYGVRMLGCNLRGARFDQVDFGKSFGRKLIQASASFRDCNLELVDLSGARLGGCELAGADLREADLRNSRKGLKVDIRQQQRLLLALGLEVFPD